MLVSDRPRLRFPSGWRLLAVVAVLALGCLGPLLVFRFLDDTNAATAAQQQLVESLREVVKELKGSASGSAASTLAEGGSSQSAVAELRSLVSKLQETLDGRGGDGASSSSSSSSADGLASLDRVGRLEALTDELRSSLEAPSRFSPFDRIADRGSAVVRINARGQYVASPSILRLPTGRLLVVLERATSWGVTNETLHKLVLASDTDGASWAQVGTIFGMNWPQIFQCKSGVYVMGTERHFSHDNNVVVSRMLDDAGARWSAPAKVTEGMSVVMANTGVDVSFGRVTRSLEVIPSMFAKRTTATLREDVTVPVQGGPGGNSWKALPEVVVKLNRVGGFVPYTLVSSPGVAPSREGGKVVLRPLFFRILEIDGTNKEMRLRLERFNHYWARSSIRIPAGGKIEVGSSSNVYGGVDWVASVISADETADLTLPGSWLFPDRHVGNPASIHSNAMRALFDVAFRADSGARNSIVGWSLDGIRSDEEAWEAGFGSVYWMEGVVVRLRDRRGANGRLLSIMRVNNDWMCDLAALVEYDDISVPGKVKGRFLRYTNVPGLGVGHPAIVYDEVSDLYWMATNANRDASRRWKQPDQPNSVTPNLHITPFSKCEVDRTTLALYYSSNAFNWNLAGVVDYHKQLGRHFAYPQMMVDGQDLVIVSRAAFAPWSANPDEPLNDFYNNHNSNAISFHRVRHFRHYANAQWAVEMGPYTATPRIVSAHDPERPDPPKQLSEEERAAELDKREANAKEQADATEDKAAEEEAKQVQADDAAKAKAEADDAAAKTEDAAKADDAGAQTKGDDTKN